MKTMGAAKFKAQCLAVMDEVQARREPVLITKKGVPVAKLEPIGQEEDALARYRIGGIEIIGDILSPTTDPDDWELD